MMEQTNASMFLETLFSNFEEKDNLIILMGDFLSRTEQNIFIKIATNLFFSDNSTVG